MSSRAILTGAFLLACAALPSTALAHDCSSPSDCAQVLSNWGCMVAMLALFLGILAATPPSSDKDKACKAADMLFWEIKWVMLPLLALLALAGAIGGLFMPASAPFEFVITWMFLMFALGTVVFYSMYLREKKKCDDP
jgi:hypothetical protein